MLILEQVSMFYDHCFYLYVFNKSWLRKTQLTAIHKSITLCMCFLSAVPANNPDSYQPWELILSGLESFNKWHQIQPSRSASVSFTTCLPLKGTSYIWEKRALIMQFCYDQSHPIKLRPKQDLALFAAISNHEYKYHQPGVKEEKILEKYCFRGHATLESREFISLKQQNMV